MVWGLQYKVQLLSVASRNGVLRNRDPQYSIPKTRIILVVTDLQTATYCSDPPPQMYQDKARRAQTFGAVVRLNTESLQVYP